MVRAINDPSCEMLGLIWEYYNTLKKLLNNLQKCNKWLTKHKINYIVITSEEIYKAISG